MSVLTPLIAAHLTLVVVGAAALLASRGVRRRDADFWHTIWTTIVVASIAAPVAALILPAVLLAVPDAAAARLGLDGQAVVPAGWAGGAIALVYAIGSGVLFLRLVAGLSLVHRLARQSYAVDGHWRRRLERLAGEAAACCRVHPRVQVPMTVGLRQRLVLLPESWIHWDDDRVLAVLRHELSHIRRRDYAWNIAGALAESLYWPNPAVWMATARVRLLAELACDREASADVGASRYAGVLVSSARELLAMGRGASRLAPGAANNLEARIGALLSDPVDRGRLRPAVRIAIAAVVAAAILSGTVLRVVPASAAGGVTHGLGTIGHGFSHTFRH